MEQSLGEDRDALILTSLFNHVAFPPKLPAHDDGGITDLGPALIDRLVLASKMMIDQAEIQDAQIIYSWEKVRQALETCKIHLRNSKSRLERTQLQTSFSNLAEGDFMVLYVPNQNAAIFIHRPVIKNDKEEVVVFEMFETSAKREQVLKTEGALTWDFPGVALEVPISVFLDVDFIMNLASFLEQASSESTKQFGGYTQKAFTDVWENRETSDPSIITSLLPAILEENGRRLMPKLLRKRVKDDVCWSTGTELPWRRLPLWLVLRVTIQRFLSLTLGGATGTMQYKLFQSVAHSVILNEGKHILTFADQEFLRRKLCRRLAKFESAFGQGRKAIPAALQDLSRRWMIHLSPLFDSTVRQATERIKAGWQVEKNHAAKVVPILPRIATDRDTQLTLKLSREYLDRARYRFASVYFQASHSGAGQHLRPRRDIAGPYIQIFECENHIRLLCEAPISPFVDLDERCKELQKIFKQYLALCQEPFRGDVEQLSHMLLIAMEVWVELDRATCARIPLLCEYHPVFTPNILDVVHTTLPQELRRARAVSAYIKLRIQGSVNPYLTIFDEPFKGTFGVRYYDSSSNLQELYEKIKEEAERVCELKTKEWREVTEQYERLSKQIELANHIFIQSSYLNAQRLTCSRQYHDPHCHKCRMEKQRGKLKIQIFEDPLKMHQGDYVKKTVVFELACPEIFSIYRDLSWTIIRSLGTKVMSQRGVPKAWNLHESSAILREFACSHRDASVVLASSKKPFLKTHYAETDFPVDISQVIKPNAAEYRYFDQQNSVILSTANKRPDFRHLCSIRALEESPFAAFLNGVHCSIAGEGPSSYEIIASRPFCPPGLSPHEFTALQTLLTSKCLRWVTILVELGSSNCNFSTEHSVTILNHLTLQCCTPGEELDDLGPTHGVLRDPVFCQRLLQQLRQRLENISSNWRETSLLEIIITLSIRIMAILFLAQEFPDELEGSHELLRNARAIAYQWVQKLREDIQQTTDPNTSKTCQRYLLRAALLCKRTWSDHLVLDPGTTVIDDLAMLVECSIIVHDNITEKMDGCTQELIARDFRMMNKLQIGIGESLVHTRGEGLTHALRDIWPATEEMRVLSTRSEPNEWFHVDFIDDNGVTLIADYNYFLGTFLANGEQLGRLQTDDQSSIIFAELFGNRSLHTLPSSRPGMMHELSIKMEGYTVNIGKDQGKTIIRAYRYGEVLEYVPRTIFVDRQDHDLPESLVQGCVHWLNVKTGKVEIRQHNIWKRSHRDWVLNVDRCKCTRTVAISKGQEVLVNPYSPLWVRISKIFKGFENSHKLLVYQPHQHSLTVDLPRFQLRFSVNRQSYLQSSHPRVQIDPNQDPGTWYGFHSKLVCLDADGSGRRTIFVPTGRLDIQPTKLHVAVVVRNPYYSRSIAYVKYTINTVLGRIDCASEPMVVYRKAALHAICSSSFEEDPLTGRNGVEEALSLLSSGIACPWAPLTSGELAELRCIAHLSPRREYYPAGRKEMKVETWNPRLPEDNQHDGFRPVVQRILEVAERLAEFDLKPISSESFDNGKPATLDPSDEHLDSRSIARRKLYRRHEYVASSLKPTEDIRYSPRDCPQNTSMKHRNTLEIVNLLQRRPNSAATIGELAIELSKEAKLDGFVDPFSGVTLTERMTMNLRRHFPSICQHVRSMASCYDAMFFLGTLAFRTDANMPLIKTLGAMCLFDELKTLAPPLEVEYDRFQFNQAPQVGDLVQLISRFCKEGPEDSLHSNPNVRRKVVAAQRAHNKQVDAECKALAQHVLDQWPCVEPTICILDEDSLINLPLATEALVIEWRRLYQNRTLSEHLKLMQALLNQRHSDAPVFQPTQFIPTEDMYDQPRKTCDIPTLRELLLLSMDSVPKNTQIFIKSIVPRKGYQLPGGADSKKFTFRTYLEPCKGDPIEELARIIEDFGSSVSKTRRRYALNLSCSLEALKGLRRVEVPEAPAVRNSNSSSFRFETERSFALVKQALIRPTPLMSVKQAYWYSVGRLWPSLTRVTLLEQIRSTHGNTFGSGTKEAIVQAGITMTYLQRERRIAACQRANQRTRLEDEIQNTGHTNWNPLEYPDWLLLEIESDILIRETQVEVAMAIANPASGENSVVQLNMGQGKTSCIIPMVASIMNTGGKCLVRVVVPRALLTQTSGLLQQRMGGLLSRKVRHVPWSRRTSTKEEKVKLYRDLHREILTERGVMLCLPEHILSFKLGGMQRLLDGEVNQAHRMTEVQSWIETVARDVLDESDHVLAVHSQLIYPSGSQMTLDGHPNRWLVIESILALTDLHLYELHRNYPKSIQVVRRKPGTFPSMIHILRSDVEDELIRRLRHDVCQGRMDILPVELMSAEDCVAVGDFLAADLPDQATTTRVSRLCPDRPQVRQSLYLLRGLFTHRILLTTLRKRFNVQYGLHPGRDPIAVPYHAKGVPSDQAEFGHCDVSILLTCLAFYHGGLSLQQSRDALEHVIKADDPASEYQRWITNDLPYYLRDWAGINMDDGQQLYQIWTSVKFHVPVIDYFLNTFVFPKYARQFKVRLQMNSWDLCSISRKPGKSEVLTTGFSGTNDIKSLLPLNISQQDLPGLSHTNASVLCSLLEPRSKRCRTLIKPKGGLSFTEKDILKLLMELNIDILIDSGALILEMDNLTLVTEWLHIRHDAQAALYFDKGDKMMIVSKQGTKTPLVASPYAENLDGVLVYIDEAHTRGTDLKFGPYAKAALTLGLGQTKDHTVQAAMRLRQLESTQSVLFFIPQEVDQSIRDTCGRDENYPISSSDVIQWLMANTCDRTEDLQPLYYSQGIDFCNRQQAKRNHSEYLKNDEHRSSYLKAVQHNERQTLQQLYAPQAKPRKSLLPKYSPEISVHVKELKARKIFHEDTGRAVHASALQVVEQEREIELEVENVRESQKPVLYNACSFPGLHRDLEILASTGRLPAGSSTVTQVWKAISKTGLGRKYKVKPDATSSRLFVSTEFQRTVKLVLESNSDQFLRSISWVLFSSLNETAVVVTPEEAEKIACILSHATTRRKGPATHLITYAAPVTRRMLHFNDLKYYSIPQLPEDWCAPEWLRTELGLFSGRLYFEWSEYAAICSVLGIDASVTTTIDDLEPSDSDFQDQNSFATIESSTKTTTTNIERQEPRHVVHPLPSLKKEETRTKGCTPKPYTFLQEWLSVRRQGMDVVHTPMGFICQGKRLYADHPFFRRDEEEVQELSKHALLPTMLEAEGGRIDGADEKGVEDMEVGTYDPSAALQLGESQSDFEYDEDDEYVQVELDEDDYEDEVVEDGHETRRKPKRGGHRGRGGRRGEIGRRLS